MDRPFYVESASSIARGVGFTRGSMDPERATLPTAFYPVGFPATLAALRLVGSTGALDLLAQSIAEALAVIGAGMLGRRAGAGGGQAGAPRGERGHGRDLDGSRAVGPAQRRGDRRGRAGLDQRGTVTMRR